MLTVVKVVLGARTAVIGVLGVGSGLILGVCTSVASRLLLALIFGRRPATLTGSIDWRVTPVLKDPPS